MIFKIRLPIHALAVLLCATTASAKENRGTPEQRAACVADAFRFCFAYAPDPGRDEYCLTQNMPDLSDACRLVFEQGAEDQQGRHGAATVNSPAIDGQAE